MIFFDYCFYRIHSFFVKNKIAVHPQIHSSNLVSAIQIFNIWTFVKLLFFIFKIKFETLIIVSPLYLIIYGINYNILLTTKKYEKLRKMYKSENHKKLKGWGVSLCLVGSFLLIMIVNWYCNG
jgi:hypothetical protein